VGKASFPRWVDLTKDVDTWSESTSRSVPPPRRWFRPEEEVAKFSIKEAFIDAVLRLGTNTDSPSDKLKAGSAGCHYNECVAFFHGLNTSRPDDFLWTCCLPYDALVESKDRVLTLTGFSVPEWVQTTSMYRAKLKEAGSGCFDWLALDRPVGVMERGVAIATLMEALPGGNTSCEGRCPFLQPLCQGASCVMPTCDDFSALCNDNTNAGTLVRAACSVTCGCASYKSALSYVDAEDGCLPGCVQVAQSLAQNSNCSDPQANSTDFAAVVKFAAIPGVARRFQLLVDEVNKTIWASLGCLALASPALSQKLLCDYDGSYSRTGKKSFMDICPVACGCLSDPSLPRCPATCGASGVLPQTSLTLPPLRPTT
jgi:hypothetical protein